MGQGVGDGTRALARCLGAGASRRAGSTLVLNIAVFTRD